MQTENIKSNASAATTAQISIEEIVAGKDVTESRKETLAIAADNGATTEQLIVLRDAVRVSRKDTIILPAHRYENLSRGRGWARKGSRDNAVWGDREEGGYRVDAGNWTVGGNDGFSRKDETKWTVKNITIGAVTFTIAI